MLITTAACPRICVWRAAHRIREMLINSGSPRRAHRREEQIRATSVDLGSGQD